MGLQSAGAIMLHLAKTSALGIDPEENARLITASVGEPWEDWEHVLSCPTARLVALSASDSRSFRFARTAMRVLWLVTLASGCARWRRLIGGETVLILDHCP